MASVVIELQRDALDRKVRTSDLLRKALVVARKLGLSELQSWINNELNGYGKGETIPAYRRVKGQARAWNPYRGWIPIVFANAEQEEWLSQRNVGMSVAEMEELLSTRKGEGMLHMPYSAELNKHLFENAPFDSEATLIVQYSSIAGMLDAARTIVLNWALKLEEDGILGEGLTFSASDKEHAQAAATNIINFNGPVQHTQIQQSTHDSIQVSGGPSTDNNALGRLIGILEDAQSKLELSIEQSREYEAELATLRAQLASPKPKEGIIREGLRSLRSILEGTAGNVAAQAVIHEIAKLLIG